MNMSQGDLRHLRWQMPFVFADSKIEYLLTKVFTHITSKGKSLRAFADLAALNLSLTDNLSVKANSHGGFFSIFSVCHFAMPKIFVGFVSILRAPNSCGLDSRCVCSLATVERCLIKFDKVFFSVSYFRCLAKSKLEIVAK